jgi:hypothetical protein
LQASNLKLEAPTLMIEIRTRIFISPQKHTLNY